MSGNTTINGSNGEHKPRNGVPLLGHRKAVELRLALSYGHSRSDLLGIAKYARLHGDWEFFSGPQTPKLAIAELPDRKPDGIIAQVTEDEQVEALVDLGVPVVNISGALEEAPFPTVRADDKAAGRMAGEHLLRRGFSRFAMVGLDSKAFSERRMEGFEKAIREVRRDADCRRWDIHYVRGEHPYPQRAKLRDALRSMPHPVGVFAVTDHLAYLVSTACRDADLRVPHDVAIIGVDNDTLTCELACPPLSSVDINAERVGYRAAEVLADLMDSGQPPEKPVLVRPQQVVTRRSTDILAVDDPLVANALEYIHERATTGIQVPGVARDLDVSRRTLERRFRRALNCTPAEEIRRTRIGQAIRLLRETDLPIVEVAERCGFRYAQHLAPVIQDATGLTPTEFRRESRSG